MSTCQHEYAVVALGLEGAALVAIVAVFGVHIVYNYGRIRTTFTTISSYAADPRSFGNRLLFALTFAVSSGLSLLLMLERWNGSDLSDFSWWAQLLIIWCLPLVGIFYTDGAGTVTTYYVGFGPGCLTIPIGVSTLIHSVAAMLFFLGIPSYLNFCAPPHPDAPSDAEAAPAGAAPDSDSTTSSVSRSCSGSETSLGSGSSSSGSSYSSQAEYHEGRAGNVGMATAARLPPLAEKQSATTMKHVLYVASFMSEIAVGLLVTVVAAGLSIHRNRSLRPCFS
ncbi:uncharacterized protein AMSG_06109 [Thecamonas trahens ATCC 50062]|uniref:Uncharacterized protein n=1 Tax=Thecamonas trahens ATCC 50062 TaxID=461836 RepID=A0A0L0DES9_THETB|nr:hypothetical protein AMSG_06109 [Thecamonas trahens ATCC 50062]KNC49828.1 hypothetical protein AMSG_06109 [Thecamonas trahens ATCC 50062]|eukprot:XP_013757322.1 hypothetical protein AMSG_06109 [Thecamonas trahens ATCC 50062]